MITFQSDASGDVMMFDQVAHRMMEIMGKDIAARGVITVEQLPGCIARLRAAIAGDKTQAARAAQARGKRAADRNEGDGEAGDDAHVGLAQRAVPLVELLERSLRREKPVLWGI